METAALLYAVRVSVGRSSLTDPVCLPLKRSDHAFAGQCADGAFDNGCQRAFAASNKVGSLLIASGYLTS